MSALVRPLGAEDTTALGEFFSAVASDEPTVAFFHPHSFDAVTAEKICSREGILADEYYAAVDRDEIVGYGMLRGWDEGYDVPTFGVCVHPTHRGERLGSQLLDHAIARARARGSTRMRLKVFPDNVVAVRLYESRGFEFTPGTGDQLVGYLLLT